MGSQETKKEKLQRFAEAFKERMGDAEIGISSSRYCVLFVIIYLSVNDCFRKLITIIEDRSRNDVRLFTNCDSTHSF